MSEETQTVEVPKGASRTVTTVVKKPDGTPLDLSGGSARWWFARHSRAEPGDVFFSKTGAVDPTDIGGQNYWKVTVNLTPPDTLNMVPGVYWHECWVRTSGGRAYPVVRGPFIVGAAVGSEADID